MSVSFQWDSNVHSSTESTNQWQCKTMHICTMIKEKLSLSKSLCKLIETRMSSNETWMMTVMGCTPDIIWNSYWQRKRQNETSYHQVLPYSVLVYWIEAMCISMSVWESYGFFVACQWYMMVQYCCDSDSTNKLFCQYFIFWQESNEMFWNMWWY